MTSKNLSTGEISIDPNALRSDLEITLINAGAASEGCWHDLVECRRYLSRVALMLPSFSDASDKTLHTLAEVDEILINIKTRLSPDEPHQTAMERHA